MDPSSSDLGSLCSQLKRLLVDDDDLDFVFRLRQFLEWDQQKLDEILFALEQVVAALGVDDPVPRWLSAFLYWAPDFVARHAEDPRVRVVNAADEAIETRRASALRLIDLRDQFFGVGTAE